MSRCQEAAEAAAAAADDLTRGGMCLGLQRGPLSAAEHLGTVVSGLARAASAAGPATTGKIAGPSRVLPAAMLHQNSFQQIPGESWAAGFRPGSSLSACPFQLFVAPAEDPLALFSPLPVWSFLPLPGPVANFSWLPRLHATAEEGEVEQSTTGHGRRRARGYENAGGRAAVGDAAAAAAAAVVVVVDDGHDEMSTACLMLKPVEEEGPLLPEAANHGEASTCFGCC